ncbi:MAG: hypothetical protein Q9220_002804 [cf. Caloplaca sp. 1 TL-2023]
MAQQSFRKSQLIAFDNVAAGHEGVLSDPSGAVVIKPCNQSEIDFYHSTSAHPHFAAFIPSFMGTLTLQPETDPASVDLASTAILNPTEAGSAIPESPQTIAHAPVVDKAWTPSNGGKIKTDLAIVLENIAAPFKNPNILDVKLGARLWDDDAPPAKRAKLDKVAEETTSKSVGLRIAGMRTWQGRSANDSAEKKVAEEGYKLYDKHYGRTLTAATVHQGFEDFFLLERGVRPTGSVRKVIKRFLEDLEALEKVLEGEESRMYSASLLFVYEGDRDGVGEALVAEQEAQVNGVNGDETHEVNDDEDEDDNDDEQAPAVYALKLIDFAHASWTPGQGSDENLLHGLRNTIRILQNIL